MVDRINQSNTADLVKELLDAEKRAEEDTARRAQIEAQAVAQIEAQDVEIQEESVARHRGHLGTSQCSARPWCAVGGVQCEREFGHRFKLE